MRFVSLIIVIIICSCASNQNIKKESIKGIYILDEDIYGIGSNIEIKENNLFEYQWQQGLIRGTTKGNYKIEGNKIILNSDLQPDGDEFQNKYEIIENNYKNTDSIKIKVEYKEGDAMQYAACFLKKKDSVVFGKASHYNGVAVLPKIDADSLCVSHIGFDYVSIPLNEFKYDDIIIRLIERNPDLEYYQFFSNRKFKYRKGKLKGTSEKFIKRK